MPGEGIREQSVFLLGAAADVVDDEGDARGGFAVAHDHDVGQVPGEHAGDDVARAEIGGIFRYREGGSAAAEESLEVGNPSVVDVFIRTGQAPFFGVFGEMGLHVFVDQLLEVHLAGVAQGTDEDIGADAAGGGHIAAGVGQGGVCGVVLDGDPDLFPGGCDQGFGAREVLGADVPQQGQDHEEREESEHGFRIDREGGMRNAELRNVSGPPRQIFDFVFLVSGLGNGSGDGHPGEIF